jgi:ATP-binding cassette, subfamily B, bacterial PglK
VNSLRKTWRLLDRSRRRQLIGLHALSIVMACSTVVGIAAIVPFFEALADPTVIRRSAVMMQLYERLHFSSEPSFVVALGVGFALSVLLANSLNLFGTLAIYRFALEAGVSLRVQLFAEYLGRDYGFHSQASSALLTSKVLYETGRIASGILQHELILVANLFTVALVLTSMVFLNPLIAACAVIGLGACYALIYAWTRGRLLANGRTETLQYAERSQVTGESLSAIKEVLVLHVQGHFVERLRALSRAISRSELSTLAISLSPRSVLECVTVLCLVGVALSLRSSQGIGPWVAQLSFVSLAAYRLLPALQQIFTAVARIRSNVPALESVAADLQQLRPAPLVRKPHGEGDTRALPLRHEARFHDVSFRYAPERPPALSGLSLSIPAGASIGIIGANGSGKTTLADILAGLLLPQSGHLTLDGVPLDQTARDSWQAAIAYVPQSVCIMDASFAENIAPGVPAGQIDLERMKRAVARARLTEIVTSLPGGYDERLGDRGSRLSGGQRQRLGIARALYREASLLILDEATSSLDVGAEEDIVDMLDSLRPALTVVHVAHRLGALRRCDLIYELRNGRLAKTSTYTELQSTARRPVGVAGRQA